MASYDAPNPYVPNTFNSSNFILPGTTITTKYLNENYLQFPFAQGTENFVSINNQGSLTQGGRAEFSSTTNPVIFTEPPTITNPVVYPATTPGDSLATITYVNEAVGGGGGGGGDVYTNLSNTFASGTSQTFQGNGNTDTIVISNTVSNSSASFYIDNNNILTTISPTGTLNFINGSGDTFSLQPITGNVCQINNPIRTGFYMESPSYIFQSSGITFGSLTGNAVSGVNNITSNCNFYLPAQTYSGSSVYGNIASTQSFVIQAVKAHSGGGDVYTTNSNIYDTGLTQTFQGNGNDTIVISNTNNNNSASIYIANGSDTLSIKSIQGLSLNNTTGGIISFGALDDNILQIQNPTVVQGSIEANTVNIVNNINDKYSLYSHGQYGLVIYNQSGNDGFGILSLTNETYTSTLTANTTGLNINSNLTIPTLTIESTSYSGELSINNQGIGSNVAINTPTQTYSSGSTYGNTLSTQSFVQQALSSSTVKIPLYSVTLDSQNQANFLYEGVNYMYSSLFQTGFPPLSTIARVSMTIYNDNSMTFKFFPSPINSNYQQYNNMISVFPFSSNGQISNNQFWTPSVLPIYNFKNILILGYFLVDVEYYNDSLQYSEQLFLQYYINGGVQGQMVGVTVIPFCPIIGTFYYIFCIVPNGAVINTFPTGVYFYVPQISLDIPSFTYS